MTFALLIYKNAIHNKLMYNKVFLCFIFAIMFCPLLVSKVDISVSMADFVDLLTSVLSFLLFFRIWKEEESNR